MSELWYHGAISREEAESLLRNHGFSQGLFLLRDSVSSPGDFVLSVVVQNSVIHYQIRHRGSDAFFSLSHDDVIIHGLNELILHYKDSGLQHSLEKFVPGSASPLATQLHGRENLLHRASAEGNLLIVSELLKCGYRDISAKNAEGQSALHIASILGHHDIVALLLEFNIPVNTSDSSGYTPLHFACQGNHERTLRLLLRHKGNPTNRNNLTSWVPLHEAAWKGHHECVTALLEAGAPSLPRTSKNETPVDLALSNRHISLASFLLNYSTFPMTKIKYWYFPKVDRTCTLELLSRKCDNGTFLIRKSQKKSGAFVLSLIWEKRFYHFEISKLGIYYSLDFGPYFTSCEALVSHYERFPDGLPTKLVTPAGNDVDSSSSLSTSSSSSVLFSDSCFFKDSSSSYSSVKSCTIGKIIGEGEFGFVHEGSIILPSGSIKSIAIKILHGNKENTDFLSEAQILKKCSHPCIVEFLGLGRNPQNSILLITELMPLGSLSTYLYFNQKHINSSLDFFRWASQITSGMMYLASSGFVHRDLASRNVLLSSKFRAKISDFGLSRTLGERNYYRASRGGKWPVKWYAPECISSGVFSTLSDVWSFGVLLWEMYTFASVTPYGYTSGSQVFDFIQRGHRLPKMKGMSDEIYELMLRCWKTQPVERPSFEELFEFFSKSNDDYINIREDSILSL